MDTRLNEVLKLCPPAVKDAVAQLAQKAALTVEEIRLRVSKPATVYADGREWKLMQHGEPILPTKDMIAQTVACASEYSVYNAQQQLSHGFCTVAGGHRVGVCGEAVTEDGRIRTLKNFSSVNLRVAHEVRGAADGLTDRIWSQPNSVLLFGPPGCGKTTLLRDTVRQLSDRLRFSVSLVDDRFEIAACVDGVPQMEVGTMTDILCGAPKYAAVSMLLRTMRPQWLALDEITEPSDVRAVTEAANCGVRLIATAHAECPDDLLQRPVYRTMLERKIFHHYVSIAGDRSLHFERMCL